jgi:hypothetical protein
VSRDSSSSGGEPPSKRRKIDFSYTPTFTPQVVDTIGAPRPPQFKTGSEFSSAIARLRGGQDELVSTRFALRVKPPGENARNVSVQGTIGVKEQSTGLVQGWLETPSNTTYLGSGYNNVVFPQNLSLQRATLEARAIKALAPMGDGYDPSAKVSELAEMPMRKTKDRVTKSKFPTANTLGMFAIGSHLEDVTANRALSLQDVGSGMRALVMTTKWQMRLDGNEDAGQRFQDRMFRMFPQLGRKDVERLDDSGKKVEMSETGISGLQSHWDGPKPRFTRENQIENIRQLHVGAQQTAHQVFLRKLNQVGGDAPPVGKWWGKNADRIKGFLPDLGSDDESKRKSASAGLEKIGQEYVQRKMDRHGIRRD